MVEILGIPVLPFAIGLYLPIHLSVPMMVGGCVRWIVEKTRKDKEQKEASENGVLYSSGLIAGEGLVGITLAILAVIELPGGGSLGNAVAGFLPGMIPALTDANVGNIIGIIAFGLLTFSLWKFCVGNKKKA